MRLLEKALAVEVRAFFVDFCMKKVIKESSFVIMNLCLI